MNAEILSRLNVSIELQLDNTSILKAENSAFDKKYYKEQEKLREKEIDIFIEFYMDQKQKKTEWANRLREISKKAREERG